MIYFAQEEDGNERYIKIGWVEDLEGNRYDTTRLESRMHNMQVGNARYLRVLAIMKGTEADERMVQEKFWDLRVATKGRGKRDTERGEWFTPKQELMDLIKLLPVYPEVHGLSDTLGDELLAYIWELPRITREEHAAEQYRQMREAARAVIPLTKRP